MGMFGTDDLDLGTQSFIRGNDVVPPVEEAGFFESAGESVQKATLQASSMLGLALSHAPAALDYARGAYEGKEFTDAQDWWMRHMVAPGYREVSALDSKSRGFAGSVIYGVGTGLAEFAMGGPSALYSMESTARTSLEVDKGTGLDDAYKLGAIQGGFAGLGAVLPASVGRTVLQKIAGGATINTAAGTGQRAAEKLQLADMGDKRAEEINVFGVQEILTDAILGSAFGYVDAKLGARRERAPSEMVDAALAREHAAFDDAQVMGIKPADVVKVDRQIDGMVQAIDRGEPMPKVDRLPDELVTPKQTEIARVDDLPDMPELAEATDYAAPDLADWRLYSQEMRDVLRSMPDRAGWAEVGGRVLRDEQGTVTGRTQWVPKEPWYQAGMGTPKQLKSAVTKALNGEPLTKKQAETVAKLLDVIEENTGAKMPPDFKPSDIPFSPGRETVSADFDLPKQELDSFKSGPADLEMPKDADITPQDFADQTAAMDSLDVPADLVELVDAYKKESQAESNWMVEKAKAVGDIMGCVLTGAGNV